MNNLTIIILIVVLFVIYNMHRTEGFAQAKANEITCGPNQFMDKDGNCYDSNWSCNAGDYNVNSNKCIKRFDVLCDKNEINNFDQKICVKEETKKVCPEDYNFDRWSSSCKKEISEIAKCPEGYKLNGSRCIKEISEIATCPEDTFLYDKAGVCVKQTTRPNCSKGYEYDKTTNKCLYITEPRCLNTTVTDINNQIKCGYNSTSKCNKPSVVLKDGDKVYCCPENSYKVKNGVCTY